MTSRIALMKLVEEVKSHSSKWMKTLDPSLSGFYWQEGYAAFSVNPRGVDRVRRYIQNQHEHHGGTEFKEELISLLEEHGMEYDPKYLWD